MFMGTVLNTVAETGLVLLAYPSLALAWGSLGVSVSLKLSKLWTGGRSKHCPESWGECLLFLRALLQMGQQPTCAPSLAPSKGCPRGGSESAEQTCASLRSVLTACWFPSLNASPFPCHGEKVNHAFHRVQGWVFISEGQQETGSLGCLVVSVVILRGRAEQLPRPQKLQPRSEADQVPVCFL